MLLMTGAAQAVNVQVNGSFETGDFTGWTQFPTGAGQQSVNGSTAGDTSSDGSFHAQINNDLPFGNSLIKNANVGVGVVAPNSPYTVTFDARGSYAVPGGVAFAEFFSELSGGGTSKAEILGGTPLAINPNPEVWTSFSFSGTTGADVSGGVTLQLGATTGPAGGTNMFYDNIVIDVTPIPVPAAVWLFGSALGLLGWMRRKAS
ncbi:MAG: hypothetical protein ACR2QV_02375 [Gammaproteobacteria bacterium]